MKWKAAGRGKRVAKSGASSQNTRLPKTCIAARGMRRAGPGPLDRVIHADANAAWREGEVHDVDVCDSGQGQPGAAHGANGETIEGQLQPVVSVI